MSDGAVAYGKPDLLTLEPDRYGYIMGAGRTQVACRLEDWVNKLPKDHPARVEYTVLKWEAKCPSDKIAYVRDKAALLCSKHTFGVNAVMDSMYRKTAIDNALLLWEEAIAACQQKSE